MIMKKILYLSIVDWDWIKQRPQIVAEQLAKTNTIVCVYPKYYSKKTLIKNNRDIANLTLIPRFKIPFSGRSAFFAKIDEKLCSLVVLKYIKKFKPDYLYVPHPSFYFKKMENLGAKIIYDCMDNYPDFVKKDAEKRRLIEKERQLCSISNIVVTSSMYLHNKLTDNYSIKDKIVLIRNGFSGQIEEEKQHSLPETNDRCIYKIAYFGTIESWFDLDSVIDCLNQDPRLEIHLAGPLKIELPKIKGLHYDGIVQHSQLSDYVERFDALFMPFKINEIIKAVDPVKLYEYINFNKPIISSYYEEISRFEDFVWFYNPRKPLYDAIKLCKEKGRKYSSSSRISFLKNNSWDERIKLLNEYLI